MLPGFEHSLFLLAHADTVDARAHGIPFAARLLLCATSSGWIDKRLVGSIFARKVHAITIRHRFPVHDRWISCSCKSCISIMLEAWKCKYLFVIVKIYHVVILITAVSTLYRWWSFSARVLCPSGWSYQTWKLPSNSEWIESSVDGWVLVLHDELRGSEKRNVLEELFVLVGSLIQVLRGWNLKISMMLWKSNWCEVLALQILISSTMIFNVARAWT